MPSDKNARRADEFADQQRDELNPSGTDALLCVADSDVQSTASTKVRALARDADAFLVERPGVAEVLARYAAGCIQHGRPFTGNDFTRLIGDYGFTSGVDVRHTRTFHAYWVRELVSMYPSLRPLVKLSSSMFDPLFDWRVRELGIEVADDDPDKVDREPATLDQLLDLVELMREYPSATCADALDYLASLTDAEDE